MAELERGGSMTAAYRGRRLEERKWNKVEGICSLVLGSDAGLRYFFPCGKEESNNFVRR
jgi:hypothetical protein